VILAQKGNILMLSTTRLRRSAFVAACLAAFAAAGCSSYYRVTDPATGGTYYTQKVEELRGGAVRFTSAGSGTSVTLQESEVTPISKAEFNEETGG
jgi:hypothetical protein